MENENDNERKVTIAVKVSPEVKEKLETMAKEDDRTLSQTAFRLLRTHPLLQQPENKAITN